jgi:hypothetical protein
MPGARCTTHRSGRSRPNPDVNILNSLNLNAYIQSDRVGNSDPVKFGLVDVPGAQVGDVLRVQGLDGQPVYDGGHVLDSGCVTVVVPDKN